MQPDSALIIPLSRPRIERAIDCDGLYVLRGDHGDRRQALREFDELINIERWGAR